MTRIGLPALAALMVLLGCAAPRPPVPRAARGGGEAVSSERASAAESRGSSREAGAEPAPVRGPAGGSPAVRGGPEDPVFARYEGRVITAADFASWLAAHRPREALASLSRMIGEDIAAREAAKEGIVLPGGFAYEQATALRSELEREAALAYGVGTTVDRYCRLRFGESEPDHLARRVQAEARRWLFSRLIRLRALRAGRVTLSTVHCARRSDADAVLAGLEKGATFSGLAERYSVHESGRDGGRLPPTSPRALHPAVRARVDRLQPGEVSGVLEIRREGRAATWQVVRLEAREAGISGTWSDLRARVERDLERQPLDVVEWTTWYLEMEALYSVRLAATFDRS